MMRGCFCFITVIMAFGWGASFVIAENLNDERADFSINNISVYISPATSICTTSDVWVTGEGEFINSGTMWFANTMPVDLYFSSSNSGDGKFIFSGNSDCTLSGEVTWGKVLMRTNGGSLLLDGDLTVEDSFEFETGVVDTGSSKIILQNNLPNSLVFNNTQENNSYIQGTFVRAIAQNGIYYFPVGDEDGFHPFYVQDAEAEGNIEVSYDSEISQEWKLVIQNASSFTIEDIGGWKVDSQVNFYPGLSLCDDSEGSSLSGDYSILYAADESSYAVGYQKSSSIQGSSFYLLGSDKLSGGIYALANEEAIQLANFIYDSGGSDNYFKIPEISKYSRIELIVYNRWGQQIYKDHNYYNGFNCSNFPQGTYFYELKLHQGESVELIRNFIEIKREK